MNAPDTPWGFFVGGLAAGSFDLLARRTW